MPIGLCQALLTCDSLIGGALVVLSYAFGLGRLKSRAILFDAASSITSRRWLYYAWLALTAINVIGFIYLLVYLLALTDYASSRLWGSTLDSSAGIWPFIVAVLILLAGAAMFVPLVMRAYRLCRRTRALGVSLWTTALGALLLLCCIAGTRTTGATQQPSWVQWIVALVFSSLLVLQTMGVDALTWYSAFEPDCAKVLTLAG